MTEDQNQTYQALSKKRIALVAFLQTMQKDNLKTAELELQLVSAMISELLTGAPINLPAKDELERIRDRSTIVIHEAKTAASSGTASAGAKVDYSRLVTETRTLIDTWPV